ncbi:MAG: type IV pilus assembly protein PilM [Actinobacteria bacterium]|nr:MAG: type IV pilus assembly protein PilM [Actinomycetota bacterium]
MARAIGLDIGTFAVRAVELSIDDVPKLVRFGQVALPRGVVRDGEVVDPASVSAAIRRLWSEAGFRSKRVVLGVANQRVIVRQAEMPAMSEEELSAALRFEAQELIPIPIDDAILDFQVLEHLQGGDNGDRVRILLAAAQQDMIRTHVRAVDDAGLRVAMVDVIPFALVRALARPGGEVLGSTGRAEAIVCVGAGVTNVVVHENGVPRFVRVLLVGGDDITDAIARELDVEPDAAEDFKRRAGNPASDADVDRAAEVVAAQLGPLVEEIRGSLEYYVAQAESLELERVLITGGGSRIPGLLERLQQALGGRVESAHVLETLDVGKVGLSEEELGEAEQLLTVPTGLALGGAPLPRGVRRISLLPSEVAVVREERRQATLVGALVAVLAVILVGLWAARGSQVSDQRHKAEAAEAKQASLQRQVGSLQGVTKLDGDISQREQGVRSVLSNDVAWTRFITDVASVMPSDVWMTSFQGTSGSPAKVIFNLNGFDHTSTARWLLRIGDLSSVTGLWVPSSTKSTNLVTFSSNANLTPSSYAKDRVDNYIGANP